jgi:FSR family fosmidomycin resistance protein-like MFS transporter
MYMYAIVMRRLRQASIFVLTLLAIELLDELVFGVREAAWPLIRDDLHLSYAQIGLLLGVPAVLASLIEPFFGILSDMGKRRRLILGGGVCFGVAMLLSGMSHNFGLLMASFILFYPASGAFVSLSQGALMDHDPARHEQNMARWTFAGSLGVVIGSLSLGALIGLGLGGWRELFLALGIAAFVLTFIARRFTFANGHSEHEESISFAQSMKNAFGALRRKDVLRWLTLLECSNLMLDILLGYLALYFVDVVGMSEAEAGIAVAVWTVVGLLGDLLLIPLLERVRGLDYLRISAALELVLFTAFLLVPNVVLKLIILGALGFFNSGWYSILQGQLYSSMPGQSGAVLTISNVFGLVGGLIPTAVGLLAERIGLGSAMWFLLIGPIALLIGLPRGRRIEPSDKTLNRQEKMI